MTAAQKHTSTHPAVPPERRTNAHVKVGSKTTPKRYARSGVGPFSLCNRLTAKQAYDQLSVDMKDVFSGSMPYALFLNKFHPARSDRPPLPKLNFTVMLRRELGETTGGYQQGRDTVSDVCRAINVSGVCPSIEFISTENVYINMDGSLAEGDPRDKLKVDASGMAKASNSQSQHSNDGQSSVIITPKWERMRVTMEFKLLAEDVVVDPDTEVEEAERKLQGVVHQTERAHLARGQASTYVLHQFGRQSRTSVTSILILENWARLLRYDHAGVVVSERFDWRANDGELLAEFLSRLEHGTPQEEGIDDSVGDLSVFGGEDSDVVKDARKAMQEFSDGMIAVPITDDAPLRSVECWDDSQLGDDGMPKSRTLIATQPLGLNFSIVGRYTVSFIGYDVEKHCAYWVKDSWPINDPEFTKEGKIYKRLVDAGVPHLAEVECAGEVRWKANKTVQRTRTDEFVKEGWSGLTANVHPLSHYRILFRDIGRPVSKFECTQQLVTALSHAVKAHSVAYEKARVLHRDISPNNILIKRNGDGMLIDWDLALLYANLQKDLTNRKPRMLWRTGTWAFLSVALLRKPFDRTHELSDDLESFFWVLLYVVLRYRYSPGKWIGAASDGDFQAYMLTLFESKSIRADGVTLGGDHKCNFLAMTQDHLTTPELMVLRDVANKNMPLPLRQLILTLRGDLRQFYADVQAAEEAAEIAIAAAELAVNDADDDDGEDDDDDDGDALPEPPRPPVATPSPALPSTIRTIPTRFDTSEYLLARFDEAAAAKWPRRKEPDSSLDRFPFIHLPPQTRQSLQEKSEPVHPTRSDQPQQRRAHDPSNDLRVRPTREQAAEDAKARAGGDYYTLPLPGRSESPRGQKRTRESALESIPEDGEREAKMAKYEMQTITLKRQDAGPPNEVFVRDAEDNIVKDAEGRSKKTEAWSAPGLTRFL
ncbi:unnamed protein product [Peniophora sp. CBMAI 1063]|nr:unnamed protein product [Peniophora sp. CBMAI 1063]